MFGSPWAVVMAGVVVILALTVALLALTLYKRRCRDDFARELARAVASHILAHDTDVLGRQLTSREEKLLEGLVGRK